MEKKFEYEIISRGWNSNDDFGYASISYSNYKNIVNKQGDERGFTIYLFNNNCDFISKKTFDTYLSQNNCDNLVEYLSNIEIGNSFFIVVADDAQTNLNDKLKEKIKELGGKNIDKLGKRNPYILLGIKGDKYSYVEYYNAIENSIHVKGNLWQDFIDVNSKVVLSIPHDGYIKKTKREKGKCKNFNNVNDKYTRKIAYEVLNNLSNRNIKVSYSLGIISRYSLDYNREWLNQCTTDPKVKEYYDLFHSNLTKLTIGNQITNVLLDLHGFNLKSKKNIGLNECEFKDISIGTKNYNTAPQELIDKIVEFFNKCYENESAVNLTNSSLNGGYIVQKYSKFLTHKKGDVAIQLELSENIRLDEEKLKKFSNVLACLIQHIEGGKFDNCFKEFESKYDGTVDSNSGENDETDLDL